MQANCLLKLEIEKTKQKLTKTAPQVVFGTDINFLFPFVSTLIHHVPFVATLAGVGEVPTVVGAATWALVMTTFSGLFARSMSISTTSMPRSMLLVVYV